VAPRLPNGKPVDRIHDLWLGKRLDVRFLDFLLSDLCIWQECREPATLSIRVPLRVSAAWMHLQMVADSKVFIVTRNKHIVPKQRRVERLSSAYSVREFRDDSQGSYWYVVTALQVVRPRNA